MKAAAKIKETKTAGKKKKVLLLKCKTRMQKMGAWTVAIVPLDIKKIFGTNSHVRIKGTIDGVPFSDSSLMPMGTGEHLLPIRSEIRKAIKKQAGEMIEIVFEQDFEEVKVPPELLEAFEASPEAEEMFNSYSPSHKRNYIRYLNESAKKETREKRAVKIVMDLEKIYRENGPQKRKKSTSGVYH
ncbi:MAG: YdeI/OmpD-associated family protein [Bacteroidia bacterium]